MATPWSRFLDDEMRLSRRPRHHATQKRGERSHVGSPSRVVVTRVQDGAAGGSRQRLANRATNAQRPDTRRRNRDTETRGNEGHAALAYIAIVLFAFQAWIKNVQTLPSDLFPPRAVASVAGFGGVGAGIGAILSTLTTGTVVDHLHSYKPILITAALRPIAGTIALFALGGPIRPIPIPE